MLYSIQYQAHVKVGCFASAHYPPQTDLKTVPTITQRHSRCSKPSEGSSIITTDCRQRVRWFHHIQYSLGLMPNTLSIQWRSEQCSRQWSRVVKLLNVNWMGEKPIGTCEGSSSETWQHTVYREMNTGNTGSSNSRYSIRIQRDESNCREIHWNIQ